MPNKPLSSVPLKVNSASLHHPAHMPGWRWAERLPLFQVHPALSDLCGVLFLDNSSPFLLHLFKIRLRHRLLWHPRFPLEESVSCWGHCYLHSPFMQIKKSPLYQPKWSYLLANGKLHVSTLEKCLLFSRNWSVLIRACGLASGMWAKF